MYCRHCGEEVSEKAEICTKCGVRIRASTVVSPSTAAVLSVFMPGVGQFYNRDVWKGVTFLVTVSILFVTTIGVVAAKYTRLGMITGGIWVILWLLNVYDAYRVATKINIQNS